ncbi:MAG: DegT/DnrJ/EryC1/StrS family aminotransferase [Ardenticatenaceae bacterium]|nr:DegT/DnrJ/EryC1/StrS family aminotransferase [Ardenticatenaceae bacterium]
MEETLALLGGARTVTVENKERWPLIGDEDVAAVTRLLRQGEISITAGTGIIRELEQAFAGYLGVRHALAQCNGTSCLHAALFAVGVGYGDEVIVPTYTWPSTASTVLLCNAIPVFCDVDPRTFTADPADVGRRITPATKAIAVVHLWGHPAEMDEIMAIAGRHGLAVVEDCSHAHGATYKGHPVGSIGDVGCFSLQASKALPGGEAGLAVTNNPDLFDRMLTLSHYGGRIEKDSLTGQYTQFAFTGFGPKYRVHPLAAAVAREQLRHLDERIEARRQNLEYLTAGLAGIPGLTPPDTAPHVTRGGWYGYRLLYDQEQMGGVPKERFMAALQAEGVEVDTERYRLLHFEPLYQGPEVAGECPYPPPEVRATMRTYDEGDLPVAEAIHPRLMSLPTFTYQPCWDLLDQYIAAFRKVAAGVEQLRTIEMPT